MNRYIKHLAQSNGYSKNGQGEKKRLEPVLKKKTKRISLHALAILLLFAAMAGTLISCGSQAPDSDIPDLYYTLPIYSRMPDKAMRGTNSWQKDGAAVISDYPHPLEIEFDSYLTVSEGMTDMPVYLTCGYDTEQAVPQILDFQLALFNKDQTETSITVTQSADNQNAFTFMLPQSAGEYIYGATVKYEPGIVRYYLKIVVQTREEQSFVNGIQLTSSAAVSPGDTEINAVWKNETDQEALFGEHFALEKQVGNAWEPVGADREAAFITIAYMLAPHSEKTHKYDLKVYTDYLEAGEYRIVTSFSQAAHAGTQYPIVLPFSVK